MNRIENVLRNGKKVPIIPFSIKQISEPEKAMFIATKFLREWSSLKFQASLQIVLAAIDPNCKLSVKNRSSLRVFLK